MLNVDHILTTFNDHGVKYMLIGGMNYAIRHAPYVTQDVDLWIEDSESNRTACEQALVSLNAEWGRTDEEWGPVATKSPGWLTRQGVFSVACPAGAIDIFRAVAGLGDWQVSYSQSISERTSLGTPYQGLSDADMLRCQLALDAALQKADRIQTLTIAIQSQADS
jgi:hypothetical protein